MKRKKLVMFSKVPSAEGARLAYTYSVIDTETGVVEAQNQKGNCLLVAHPEMEELLSQVEAYINTNILKEG